MTINDKQYEQMVKEFLAIKAENERLKANASTAPKTGLKVSPKGALSVYGCGRFPVTLYASQWTKLLERADDIKKFIDANKATLKTKEA